MYKGLLSLLVLFCAVLNAQQLNKSQKVLNKSDKSYFIENKGQWPGEVKYLARLGGMNTWITNSGVVYDYYKINKNYDESKTLRMSPDEKREYEKKNTSVQGHVVKLQIVNEEKDVLQVGNNKKAGYVNYFTGNHKSKWASNVPLYDNVELQGVYKDIDVKYYYDNGMLRYDYKVKPGADASQIKFKFEGQDGIRINERGELILRTSLGEVTNGKIYAYQSESGTQKEVECRFEQKQDGTLGLKAGSYDVKKELIIDPLVYSTFIGGNSYDSGCSIAKDDTGNVYITGSTISSNYPTTVGAYQTSFGGGNGDVFVTKLNSSGTALVYSTYIGGSSDDIGFSIAVDAIGYTYIAGATNSPNFPITAGAYQTALSGNNDCFITKLNPNGTALIYSTYFGGNSDDCAYSLVPDGSGNVYITGYTASSNYPITAGAFQTALAGTSDIFVTKLNSTGTALVYSTYIGGSNINKGLSIAIDNSGNAYITGNTSSSNYPVTAGAFQTTLGGSCDAIVTKLNATGTALVYSTYLGGNNQDLGNSIAVDAGGYTYIAGSTYSINYPVTAGAFQTTLGGSYDAFVAKLNPAGTALVYSTYIGGTGYDAGSSIAIDVIGNAYLAGSTSSTNYPVTSGAYQTVYGGGIYDIFVTKLDPTGSTLVYSTYFGGNSNDGGGNLALEETSSVYILGQTSSTNFPTTSGAYQSTYGGGTVDAFVAKLYLAPLAPPAVVHTISPFNNSIGIVKPVQFKWQSSTGALSYRFQLSTSSTFATTVVDTASLTDTSFNTSNLNNLTTYYWRVNASNPAGASAWSTVWNFKTLGNPTKAELIYPTANSINIPVTVSFKWNQSEDQRKLASKNASLKNAKSITTIGTSGKKNISNVSLYWFELKTDTTSSSYTTNDSTLTDTVKTVSGLACLTNYWWRVKAKNETGWGDYTGWSKFTTVVAVPDAPVLLYPNSSSNIIANGSHVSFSWKSASFASKYELQIATDNNCNTVLTDTTGITDTVFTGNLYYCYNYSAFYWRVRGINESGAGQWSSPMSVSIITGINDSKNNIPVAYQLYQNYPNPFNPSTLIKYALPFNSIVKIEIYDILGAKVKELLNGQETAGYYSVNFNTTGLASGVYLYVLKAKSVDGKSEYRETKKMMLLK